MPTQRHVVASRLGFRHTTITPSRSLSFIAFHLEDLLIKLSSMIPCVTVGPACTRHRQTGRVTNYDKLGNHRRRSLLPIVPRTYTSTICSKVYSFLALSKTSDIILHDHHALIHPRYRHIGWLSCQSTPRGLKQLFHCHYTHCCAYHDVHFLLYFHCH